MLKRTNWGYACNPNMAAVLMVGLGCEGFQIERMKEAYGVAESDVFRTLTIQETGGTRKAVAAGIDALKIMLPIANKAVRETVPASELMLALQCGGSDGYSGITANPGAGRRRRPAGRAWRHRHPVRDAGDLWRRASADAPRRDARGRREARRHHQLVGGLYRPRPDGHEQQPLARQQGGRADHHPGKVAGRGRQGRHHDAGGGLSLCRAGEGEGLRLHGHARLRPGLGDGAGGGRRQHPRLHHRPRLGLWLQADAVDQARHQHADLREA